VHRAHRIAIERRHREDDQAAPRVVRRQAGDEYPVSGNDPAETPETEILIVGRITRYLGKAKESASMASLPPAESREAGVEKLCRVASGATRVSRAELRTAIVMTDLLTGVVRMKRFCLRSRADDQFETRIHDVGLPPRRYLADSTGRERIHTRGRRIVTAWNDSVRTMP
jgi:hypothetical protein